MVLEVKRLLDSKTILSGVHFLSIPPFIIVLGIIAKFQQSCITCYKLCCEGMV